MKKIHPLIIVLCVLLVIASLFVFAFVYAEHYAKEEICRVDSPSGEYTYVLTQIGSPGWPFGPVKAQIKVLNSKGRTVDKSTFWVNNDGGGLSATQIKDVRWNDASVEIDLKGADDAEPTTYTYELD